MKFNVRKDIDAFEKKYLGVLQALADAWIGKKYTVVIARDGVSYISEADKSIHIDPTGRLMYLYGMGAYATIYTAPSIRMFDPNDVGETMLFYAKTALLHEALHALHTDSVAVCTYMEQLKTLADLRVFHSIFNCIEDGYIEYKFADELYEDASTLLYHLRQIENDALIKPQYAVMLAGSDIKLNDTAPFSEAQFNGFDNCRRAKIKSALKQLYDYLNAVLILSTEDECDAGDTLADLGLSGLKNINDLYAILPACYDDLDTAQRLDLSMQVFDIVKRSVDNFEILHDYFNQNNFRYGLRANESECFYTYSGWQKNYGKFVDCGKRGSFINILETENGAVIIAHQVGSSADSDTVYLDNVRIDDKADGLEVKLDYEDERSYNRKNRDDGTVIELNYKRNSDIWIKIPEDKNLPALSGFFVHAVKDNYGKESEQKLKDVCNGNFACIKATEQALLAVLSSGKHNVIRKQPYGVKLDSRNLADIKKRIFLMPSASKCDNFDISVLIDTSGSVNKKAYDELCVKTVCFIKACDNIGLPTRVQSFCSVNGKGNLYLNTNKDFSESLIALSSLYNEEHGSYNSFDWLAIQNILPSLKMAPQTRHIVLYITDGHGLYVSKSGAQYTALSCQKEIERVCLKLVHRGIAFIPVCFDSAAIKNMPSVFRGAVCCKTTTELKTRLVPKIAEELWKI